MNKERKLMTVRNYATYMEVTPQTVYNWAKDLNLFSLVEIDGVKFVDLSDSKTPKRVEI